MSAERNPAIMFATAAMALSLTLVGCAGSGGSSSGADAPPGPSRSESGSGSSGEDSVTERGADLATAQFAVSWEDAVDTARGNFDGELAEVGLDWTRDRYAYKIELVSDTEEYELRIDADSGEQFGERTEKIESDDLAEKRAEAVDLGDVVPWKEALATALDARSGTVNEWKLEGAKHGPRWEFDIGGESGEDVEATIDARTGELIGADD